MIATYPFPHDLPFPGHFEDNIVQQPFVRDLGIDQVLMGKNEGVAAVHERVHARNIIPYRVPLPLVVMVLTGHPLGFFIRVLDEFPLIEFPHDLPAEVHLDEIDLVLPRKGIGTLCALLRCRKQKVHSRNNNQRCHPTRF